MGFRLDRTYVLQFEGAMEGAYVKLRSTPVGVALELRGGASDSLSVQRGAELLAQYVLEWNLDASDGGTLPVTAEAIIGQLEEVVLVKILVEWYKAAAGVTAPLDPPIEDIPMTVPAG